MTPDERAMLRALRLAERGRGRTHPNPMVGAVVTRGGEVIAEGWHRRPGGPHAELEALRVLHGRAPGATMHVNLEPCCHHGRTPPCTDALLASGVERVVVGMVDPNPLVDGRGIERLRAAGVEVVTGVLEARALSLNAAYVTWATRGRPHVTVKVAATADGRTATRSGESRWITSEAARAHVHRRRAEAQAVLVGSGTVLADDPALTARPRGGAARQPARVVLDGRLRTPSGARVLADDGVAVWVFTTREALEGPRADALARRARVVAAGEGGRVDLGAVLAALHGAGIADLVVEGGPTIAGAFFDAGLVDRFTLYLAPTVVGGDAARPMVGGLGVDALARAHRLGRLEVRRLGPDLVIEAAVSPAPAGG